MSGNHADYGDYGAQAGDGTGTISREEQMQKTANWMDEFCNESAKDSLNGQEDLKNKYSLNTKQFR